MNGAQVSNLCQLLDSLSWVMDERFHVQELVRINEREYAHLYKLHFQDKMDVSYFLDSLPRELPQAPRRLRYISSYRSSLRSLKSVGYIVPKVGRGSISKRHRHSRQIMIRGAPKTGPAASSVPGDRSPEIWKIFEIFCSQVFCRSGGPTFGGIWENF